MWKPATHAPDHRPGGIDPNMPGGMHQVGASGEPAFQNGWSNQAGDDVVAMYFLIVIGRPNELNAARDTIIRYHHKVLEIAGDVAGGADGTVVFTLPLEFRQEFSAPMSAHDDAGVYVPCRVYANGEFVRGIP